MAYCYFDGALLEESNVSLPLDNLGLQRGFGVFDLFRVREGKAVFIEDHLDRFMKSQDFMDLEGRIERDEIRDAIQGLQEWNGYSECCYRLTLLAQGDERDDYFRPLFYITNHDLSEHDTPDVAAVITYSYQRDFPEVKSVNYFASNVLHRMKKKAGALDVVYHQDDRVSEASRSSLFIVTDGVLQTPRKNVLKGVTRKQILSFSPDFIPTETTDISIEAFKKADEAFICSTLKEIIPITKVDGKSIGSGKPGPFTRKIQKRFNGILRESSVLI